MTRYCPVPSDGFEFLRKERSVMSWNRPVWHEPVVSEPSLGSQCSMRRPFRCYHDIMNVNLQLRSFVYTWDDAECVTFSTVHMSFQDCQEYRAKIMHKGKIFNLIFPSPTVVNLVFFQVKFFQLYFSKSYSRVVTVGLRKIRLKISLYALFLHDTLT